MKTTRRADPGGIFVYGTLMRGETRYGILREFGVECALLADTPGRLLDLGTFPGLVPDEKDGRFVRGELIRCRDHERLLRRLDEIEGFRGPGREDNLFERKVVPVGMLDGHVREAWAYVYARPAGGAPVIASGDWREYRGTRQRVLRAIVRGHCGGDEQAVARALVRSYPTPPTDFHEAVEEILPLAEAFERGAFSERELAMASGRWAVEIDDLAVS